MSVALPLLEAMRPGPSCAGSADRTGVRRCAWRSSTSPTASTCPTGRRGRLGADFELPAILEPLRRGQGRRPRPERADPEPGAGPRRRRGRPRPRHGQLPDRPPPAEDRRRRPPRRDLRRPGGRPGDRAVDPLPLAGDRLRGGQERAANATTAIAVPISPTFRGGANRRPSPSRSIPAWSSIGSSAARPAASGGADAGPGRSATQEHPRLRRRGRPTAQASASAPPTAASWMNTSPACARSSSGSAAPGRRSTSGGMKYPRPLGIPADYQEHLRLMGDLLVLAFQSDLTRIATFVFANDGSNRSYRPSASPTATTTSRTTAATRPSRSEIRQDQPVPRRPVGVPAREAEVDPRRATAPCWTTA